jgi:hypothetical protein
MKTLLTMLALAMFSAGFAQHPAEAALEKDSKTLEQRYQVMKDKSETFNEYKVIKAYILDGMWKLTRDSIRQKQASLQEARDEVSQLKSQVSSTLSTLKQKEESMEEVVHSSTHITVFGADLGKNFFLGVMAAIVSALIIIIGLISGRLKMMYVSLREKIDLENSVSKEFENYKRKALEKQMKLSRELQDERNRIEELRGISTN